MTHTEDQLCYNFPMPDWVQTCFLVAAGGAAGSVARFWSGRGVARIQTAQWPELEFPLGTFLVNVLGSLLLGFLAALCIGHAEPSRRQWYLLLGTGFCGGFTTFSTFSLETYELMRDGKLGPALLYACGSIVAGVFGVWCAMRVMGK